MVVVETDDMRDRENSSGGKLELANDEKESKDEKIILVLLFIITKPRIILEKIESGDRRKIRQPQHLVSSICSFFYRLWFLSFFLNTGTAISPHPSPSRLHKLVIFPQFYFNLGLGQNGGM